MYLIITIVLILIPKWLIAADIINITPNQEKYAIGKFIDILEDPEKKVTIEEVTNPENAKRFRPSQVDTPAFGFTKSAYWIRFTLKNQSDKPTQMFLELAIPRIENVNFFIQTKEGIFIQKKGGTMIAYVERDVKHRHHVFSFLLEPNEQKTFYMQAYSRGTIIQFPLSLLTLDKLHEDQTRENMVLGLFIGVLLAMLFYNLFLYFSLKESMYFYYVISLFILVPVTMDLEGLSSEYFWPTKPIFAKYMYQIWQALYFITITYFAKTFLNTKSTIRVHFTLKITIFIQIMIAVIEIFFPTHFITSFRMGFTLLHALILLVVGLIRWCSEYQPARLYVLASFSFLMGVILLALERLGFTARTFLTVHGWQVGSLLEMLLFSLALADKINYLKQTAFESQQLVLQLQEEANAQLELKVAQRTRAIEQSPVSIVITDLNGLIEYVNPKFTELSLYSFEEVKGRNSNFLKSGNTPFETYEELWKSIQSGKEWKGIFHNKKKNGDLYWEQASISPLLDANGKITHYVGVKEDITERLKMESALKEEKEKSDNLLHNILPEAVASELKKNGLYAPRYYREASVLFTDFKGFTGLAESMSPIELLNELNYFFEKFDEIIDSYGMERIKTIGDAYMAVSGVPISNENHAIHAVSAALAIQKMVYSKNLPNQNSNLPIWDLRIGIHSGPVIAGVVGKKKFAYDIWGDTVNLAARLESSGEVGKVNISGSVYQKVKEHFQFEYRGKIAAKNKGHIDMYFVY